MDAVKDFFRNDRFAEANGIELVEVRPGYARTRMSIGERHLNSVGVVHGGALFTLAALALVAAASSRGKVAVGTDLSICFVKAGKSGTLIAEATEEARGRKLCTATVRVTDATQALIALVQGTTYLKDEPELPAAP